MKMIRVLSVVALCGLFASCGGQPPSGGEVASVEDQLTSAIGVRLRGDNPGSLTSLTTKVHAVSVWADGAPVAVTLTGQTVNLANAAQAWLVASFVLPAGANHVRLSLELADSAAWAGGGGSGSVDLRGAPIVLELRASDLEARGKVVLHADLARSIVVDSGAKIFLPQLRIVY